MKKFGKVLILAAAMTMLFALPVMAAGDDKEVTISSENTDTLIQLTDAHNLKILSTVEDVSKFATGDAAMVDAKNHLIVVYNQLRKEDQDIAANHIYYLQQVVVNATENARVKKEVVDNYTSLAAGNPYFASLLPQATADYNTALAQLAQAQNNVAVAQVKLAKYYQ